MGPFVTLLLFFVLFLILYFIFSLHKERTYFESRGIPYMGNGTVLMIKGAIKGLGFIEGFLGQYKRMTTKGHKVVGGMDCGQKCLVIADLDLLNATLIKDFDHFTDRRDFGSPLQDVLFKKMLCTQTGVKWEGLKAKMNPAFTPGKIKDVFFPHFNKSGEKLVNYLEDGEIDLSKAFSKFTMDVIASAGCGIDSQAFSQKESSLFEQMASKLQFQFSWLSIPKFILIAMVPKLASWLNLSFFDKEMQDYFTNTIKYSINNRSEKPKDFLTLMLDAREGSLKPDEVNDVEETAQLKPGDFDPSELLDDEGIVANCVQFIFAGFDHSHSALLFCAYGLALNEEVQDRLRKEIEDVLVENENELSYDALEKMDYLDMVINETLRLYPPAPSSDRGCTRDYKVLGTDFTLQKGQSIVVPIYGIHHDERYYPNPEFDPERFSPENRRKLMKGAFLPFGRGPRSCLGMRFALTAVKVAIVHLVHNFRLSPSKRTLIPMKFSQNCTLKPEGGMFLSLSRIPH